MRYLVVAIRPKHPPGAVNAWVLGNRFLALDKAKGIAYSDSEAAAILRVLSEKDEDEVLLEGIKTQEHSLIRVLTLKRVNPADATRNPWISMARLSERDLRSIYSINAPLHWALRSLPWHR